MLSMNNDSKNDSKSQSAKVVDSWVEKYTPRNWGDDSDDEEDPVIPVTTATTTVSKQCPWAPIKAPVISFKEIQKEVQPIRPKEVRESKETIRPIKPVKSTNGIRTLMVKNLPRDTTPQRLTEEIRAVFEKYGSLKDVYIPKNMDKSSEYFGTIKGFAKVQFLRADDASTAALYPCSIRRNTLYIEFAKEDRWISLQKPIKTRKLENKN